MRLAPVGRADPPAVAPATAGALAYARRHRERFLAELSDLVRFPSVSADPRHAGNVAACARWLADHLRGLGATVARVLPTARHPVVHGAWRGARGQPIALIYGHYDVVSPDPLGAWRSPPFEATRRGDSLYGRGTSDDKGQLFAHVKALEAWLHTSGTLPVNVTCQFEGEEEIGSPSLGGLLAEYARELAADVAVVSDTSILGSGRPALTYALRGMLSLEMRVAGPRRDLHSGRFGGAVHNPAQVLCDLVSGLHDAAGRVAVAGFYDEVRELSQAERDAIAALAYDERAYLTQVGAPSAFGEPGYTTLERQWARPTLEVNGMWGGYQGPGQKTVIPREAHAKITCRLVPDQRPDEVLARVAHHLEMHVPSGARLSLSLADHGSRATHIPADHFALQAADRALQATYGVRPLVVRMGGTVPISELFQRHMELDTVFFSFSTADEDFHAPNEFFRVHRLHEGLEAWARCWDILGEVNA